MHSLKVLRYGSHSFTCKFHHACLSFVSVHQMAPPLTEVANIQLQSVCLSVCVYVCPLAYLKITCQNFTKFSVAVAWSSFDNILYLWLCGWRNGANHQVLPCGNNKQQLCCVHGGEVCCPGLACYGLLLIKSKFVMVHMLALIWLCSSLWDYSW